MASILHFNTFIFTDKIHTLQVCDIKISFSVINAILNRRVTDLLKKQVNVFVSVSVQFLLEGGDSGW